MDKSITLKAFKEKKLSQIIIEVIDEGVGISKDHLKHIFDPFFIT